MVALSQAKVLGGIGAILIFIPFVSLVGYILLIVAVKDISDYLHDRSVFNNVLFAALSGIVGALAVGVVFVGLVRSGVSFGGSAVTGIVLAWIFLIVSAFFLRRAYDKMAQGLGVGTFRTAATLYLVGAALTIVLVGFLLLFIAEILQAVAYFSIPDQAPVQSPGGSPPAVTAAPSLLSPAPPPGAAAKFCTSCGTRISPTATFCYNCGAKQQP
jgi:uncharacterized membrane protein